MTPWPNSSMASSMGTGAMFSPVENLNKNNLRKQQYIDCKIIVFVTFHTIFNTFAIICLV